MDEDYTVECSAHFIEAGYEAYTQDPENEQIRTSLSQPLEWTVLDRPGLNWSAELLASGGAPLTVIDILDMGALLGAEVDRPYWRSGGWSERPHSEINE